MRSPDSIGSNNGEVKIQKAKNWFPAWISPVVTVLIGIWVLFYRCSHQGPEVILITANAEGVKGGKTTIKSRSVDVGVVESATLAGDLTHAEIKTRPNSGTEKLLHKDTVLWAVKSQIGREGIGGLGTLLPGVYIELQPDAKDSKMNKYDLLDSSPLAPPDAKSIRVLLDSKKARQLSLGDPILFRGYRVDLAKTSTFDTQKRNIRYQLSVNAPYDRLVTSNIRFWKDSGITVDLTSVGVHMEMGSLTTLLSSDVSFDVLGGLDSEQPVVPKTAFVLHDDQKSIQDSLYAGHTDCLMFFKGSVRDLQPGAPVEFRDIRLGTVSKVPLFAPNMCQTLNDDHRILVLIRIEPERLKIQLGENADVAEHPGELLKRGLHGPLKTGNLIAGALYVDLDSYSNTPAVIGIRESSGYQIIPTVSDGLAQTQQQLMEMLDKINELPLNPMVEQVISTPSGSQRTMRDLQTTLDSMNKALTGQSMQQLSTGIQSTLCKLSRSMQGFQLGSVAYNKMVADMQCLDQVL